MKEKSSLTESQSWILTCFSKKASEKTKQEAAEKLATNYPSIKYDLELADIIEKQRGRIDLLLENEKHLIVIENKIKSKINGEKAGLNGKIESPAKVSGIELGDIITKINGEKIENGYMTF